MRNYLYKDLTGEMACLSHPVHLGNTRVTYHADENHNAEIVQEDHYYPFGMRLAGMGTDANSDNKFLYNGKELEDDFNLNLYHYGARHYDPQLGKWLQVDPADEFHSPYVYCANNPVIFIDPDGRAIIVAPELQDAWDSVMSYLESKPRNLHLVIEGLDKYSTEKGKDIYISSAEINEYDHNTNTVKWNKNQDYVKKNGTVVAPFIGLIHELGHASQHLRKKDEYFNGLKSGEVKSKSGKLYPDKEELRNVEKWENSFLKVLKLELREEYFDYKGAETAEDIPFVETKGPLSDEIK